MAERLARTLLGLACLMGLCFGAGLARDRGFDDATREGLTAIERWERLSDEQRARLRERFERYRSMSEEERRELEERAENLRRLRRRLFAGLSDEDRARLAALPAGQRETIEVELLEDALKAEGKRLHAKLPPEWRERLEEASPEDRRKFFADFKRRNRSRMSLFALENMGRRLELPREEIDAMKQLPEQERLGKVLELRKLLQQRSVETFGLPEGLTPDAWSRMLALPAEEFFAEVMRVRESGGWRDKAQGEETPEEAPLAERRRRAAWDLLGELRPRPAERLELAELSPRERREEISRRRRERALATLARHEVHPPEELAALAQLPDSEFYAAVRKLVRESGALEERRPDR